MPIKVIPQNGFQGETALREAAAGEYRAIMDMVRRALADTLYPGQRDAWVEIAAIYADRAVVRRDGRLYAYPYTLSDDNQVQLGQPEEVVLDHKAVAMREAQGAFLEAKDDKGTKWRICVIKAGLSGNRNYYPDAVLREAVPLFHGARVFEKSDEEHLKGKGKSFGQLIGRLSNAQFIEGRGKDSGQIQADLELLASAGDAPAKMLEAWNRGMADLFGFSVDVNGRARMRDGQRMATRFSKVNSVDLIIEPGAGGQLINLLEAIDPEVEADMKLRERMIEAVKKAHKGSLPDGLDIDNDGALETAYREALSTNNDGGGKQAPGAGAPAAGGAVSLDDVDTRIRLAEAKAGARGTVRASGLPPAAQDRLLGRIETLTEFKEGAVDELVKGERDYIASFTESGHVTGVGDTRAEGGESNLSKMLDAFFDPEKHDVRSFKESYIAVTGDRRITGSVRDCDPARLREALGDSPFREALDSTSFSNVLGDSITRRLLREYANKSRYDVWRLLADVVPVSDFRTQERTRYGGYGDLPIVAEKGPYPALASPSDEKATYAVAKRGGTEQVTLEMIRNDDVGAIQRIPGKLNSAAKRTLGKFVLDFIATNPVIYDGTNLFTAGHGNLGSAALAAASLAARRLAMLKQTEAGSNEQLSIPAANVWVPADLEETGFDLFRRATNNDTDFVESLQMNVIPVWYWTDANDWAITADKADIPLIEIGFLDGNEEPELFVQDSPTGGSLFSNDVITYKLRHIYGGNVMDFRGFDKSVVA